MATASPPYRQVGAGAPGASYLDVTELVVLKGHLRDLWRVESCGSLGAGKLGISQRLPSLCQSEQLYKRGIAFSAPSIPESMEPF